MNKNIHVNYLKIVSLFLIFTYCSGFVSGSVIMNSNCKEYMTYYKLNKDLEKFGFSSKNLTSSIQLKNNLLIKMNEKIYTNENSGEVPKLLDEELENKNLIFTPSEKLNETKDIPIEVKEQVQQILVSDNKSIINENKLFSNITREDIKEFDKATSSFISSDDLLKIIKNMDDTNIQNFNKITSDIDKESQKAQLCGDVSVIPLLGELAKESPLIMQIVGYLKTLSVLHPYICAVVILIIVTMVIAGCVYAIIKYMETSVAVDLLMSSFTSEQKDPIFTKESNDITFNVYEQKDNGNNSIFILEFSQKSKDQMKSDYFIKTKQDLNEFKLINKPSTLLENSNKKDLIVPDIDQYDWDKAFEKYKKEMESSDIHFIMTKNCDICIKASSKEMSTIMQIGGLLVYEFIKCCKFFKDPKVALFVSVIGFTCYCIAVHELSDANGNFNFKVSFHEFKELKSLEEAKQKFKDKGFKVPISWNGKNKTLKLKSYQKIVDKHYDRVYKIYESLQSKKNNISN